MNKVYCVNLHYKLLFVFLKESSQRVNTVKLIIVTMVTRVKFSSFFNLELGILLSSGLLGRLP